MLDREKVIKGIDICLNRFHCGAECPYYDNSGCQEQLRDDALELLKEQEAKPPAIMQDVEGIWATCSMCGHKLRPILSMEMDTYFPKFCSECGQAVKWE